MGSVGQFNDGIQIVNAKIPSWCGIYVNWIAKQENLVSTKWKVGGGNVDYKKWPRGRPQDGARPGDVLYSQHNRQHECIVISFDKATGKYTTIDGNTAPGGGTNGGQILVQERRHDFFSHVFKFQG